MPLRGAFSFQQEAGASREELLALLEKLNAGTR